MVIRTLILSLLHLTQGQTDAASWTKLRFDPQVWTFTVPAEVNGREISAVIDLSREDTIVDSSFVSPLARVGEKVFCEVGVLNTSQSHCEVVPMERIGVISLGRGFFRTSVLVWDIQNSRVKIDNYRNEQAEGVNIRYSAGTFILERKPITLPQISPVTQVPYGLKVSNGFELMRPSRVVNVLDGSGVYGILLTGRQQAAVGTPRFRLTTSEITEENVRFIPGAPFFGDQTIVIDFKKNKLHFETDNILNNLYLFRLRLYLARFEINGDQIILRDIDEPERRKIFQDKGVIGMALRRIGRIEIAVSRFKDRSFLMSVLKELETGGELEFNDPTKTVPERFRS